MTYQKFDHKNIYNRDYQKNSDPYFFTRKTESPTTKETCTRKKKTDKNRIWNELFSLRAQLKLIEQIGHVKKLVKSVLAPVQQFYRNFTFIFVHFSEDNASYIYTRTFSISSIEQCFKSLRI